MAGPSDRPARVDRALSLWGPPVIYALAIFVSSSLSTVPSPPARLTDKHMHVLAYAGLSLVLLRALSSARWTGVTVATVAQAAIIAVAYGGSDEWHQSFVPGRAAELSDVGADAVGAVLAVAAALGVARWSRRGERADGTIERSAGKVGHTP